MRGPTPRQQAGYISRLLRRGEIELIDPRTGRPAAASVELRNGTILLALRSDPAEILGAQLGEEERWSRVFQRLRAHLSVEEVEALSEAVEIEGAGPQRRSYMPQST